MHKRLKGLFFLKLNSRAKCAAQYFLSIKSQKQLSQENSFLDRLLGMLGKLVGLHSAGTKHLCKLQHFEKYSSFDTSMHS